MTQTQNDILNILFSTGPLTDRQLIHATQMREVFTTDSGIRSRRAELARKGLVESIGRTTTPTGTKTRVWNLTNAGETVVLSNWTVV